MENLLIQDQKVANITPKENKVFFLKIISGFIFLLILQQLFISIGMPSNDIFKFPVNLAFCYMYCTPWGFTSSVWIKWDVFKRIPFFGTFIYLSLKISVGMIIGFWAFLKDISIRQDKISAKRSRELHGSINSD